MNNTTVENLLKIISDGTSKMNTTNTLLTIVNAVEYIRTLEAELTALKAALAPVVDVHLTGSKNPDEFTYK